MGPTVPPKYQSPFEESSLFARPAFSVVYAIAGRRLLIEAQDAWSAQVVSTLFDGWFLHLLPTNGRASQDVTIKIRCGESPPPVPEGFTAFEIALGGICHTDGRTFHLAFNGSSIIIGSGRPSYVDVWIRERYDVGSKFLSQIISQSFSAALRRCGLFELHSAGVVAPGHNKAVLIAGSSGSGKSTLTLQLAARGWNYLSDDTVLLEQGRHGIEVHALRRFFALTEQTIEAVQLPGLVSRASGLLKERVTPRDLFPQGQIQRCRPGTIFFTMLTGVAESRVMRLTAAEAMTRLIRLCPWAAYDKPTAGKHLRVMAALARDCVAFDFHAGTDVLKAQSRAADLLAGYVNT